MFIHAVRCATAGLCIAVSTHAFADQLFTGTVLHQVVQSSGTAECAAPPAPVTSTPLPNGGTHVTISNYGGCQLAEIRVLHDFAGTDDGEIRRIASRSGEFDRLNFPTSGATILVQVGGDGSHWAPVLNENGVAVFPASFLRNFKGLDPAVFHPNPNGLIPLDELASQLHQ